MNRIEYPVAPPPMAPNMRGLSLPPPFPMCRGAGCSSKQSLKAAYHTLVSSVESKQVQPGVNLGSTWGQPGVNLHRPTDGIVGGGLAPGGGSVDEKAHLHAGAAWQGLAVFYEEVSGEHLLSLS